jgi:cobalt/nickel transport system permease protein
LQATIEGVALAGIVTLKANAIVLAILALIGTMPVAVLGHGLQRLHVPAKICHLLLFTYRYIFIIEQEYGKLITAMKIRGFVPGTDMHTYRSYANLLGMLLVRSLDRADRIYQAMLCRGFQGNFVSLATFSSRPRDYLFGLIMLLVLSGLLLLGTG